MHVESITARRVTVDKKGLTIDGDMMINTEVIGADLLRQHLPDVTRLEELPTELQECINKLFELCTERLVHKHG